MLCPTRPLRNVSGVCFLWGADDINCKRASYMRVAIDMQNNYFLLRVVKQTHTRMHAGDVCVPAYTPQSCVQRTCSDTMVVRKVVIFARVHYIFTIIMIR